MRMRLPLVPSFLDNFSNESSDKEEDIRTSFDKFTLGGTKSVFPLVLVLGFQVLFCQMD